jgi:hypothetical protein
MNQWINALVFLTFRINFGYDFKFNIQLFLLQQNIVFNAREFSIYYKSQAIHENTRRTRLLFIISILNSLKQ